MKTFRSLLLSLFLVMFLTACGGEDKQASLFTETDTETSNEQEGEAPKEENRGFFQRFLKDEEEVPQDTIDQSSEEATTDISEEGVSLQILYPKTAKRVETSNTHVVIWGEIQNAEKVAKVQVNDYVLQKYNAGEKQFSYIAAQSLGTLERGENTYEIKALDKDGKLLSQTTYTIDSDVKYAALTDSGFESWILALIVAALASGVIVQRRNTF